MNVYSILVANFIFKNKNLSIFQCLHIRTHKNGATFKCSATSFFFDFVSVDSWVYSEENERWSDCLFGGLHSSNSGMKECQQIHVQQYQKDTMIHDSLCKTDMMTVFIFPFLAIDFNNL